MAELQALGKLLDEQILLISESASVTIGVYNSLGQLVASAGEHANLLRKEASSKHNQIQQLETYLKCALDLSNEAVIVVNTDERIVAVSEAASFLLNKPKDSLHNRELNEVVPQKVMETIHLGRSFRILDLEGLRWEGRPISGNKDLQGMILLLSKSNKGSKRNSQLKPRFGLMDIRGTSRAITLIKEKVQRIAPTELSVLIRGESGTGKELFAGAIHSESFRQDGPFVAINCAALPENLMESELFGYEDGAFTGARKGGKLGKFELANDGTLFLDEIGEMPLLLQAKLLRALQFKEIERIGGTQPVQVDIRLIGATNKPLEKMIEEGTFREDLYYRLNVIPLDIPPLRERIEDITVLLELFTKRVKFNKGTGAMRWSAEALNAIYKYHWPGNVRELENAVEYAVSMNVSDRIQITCLPERIIRSVQSINECETTTLNTSDIISKPPMLQQPKLNSPISEMTSLNKETKNTKDVPPPPANSITKEEIQVIRELLANYGTTTKGKEMAARTLGISRATLYRRLKIMNSLGYFVEEI
jgi:sigma-54 dependent transcriptional regulator, acetoin dehydrogenase operon transcriptional activator AcoR